MAVVTALSLGQAAPSKQTFRVELARAGEFLPIEPVIAPKNLCHRARNYKFRHGVCAATFALFRVLFRLQKARTVGNPERLCRLLKLGKALLVVAVVHAEVAEVATFGDELLADGGLHGALDFVRVRAVGESATTHVGPELAEEAFDLFLFHVP